MNKIRVFFLWLLLWSGCSNGAIPNSNQDTEPDSSASENETSDSSADTVIGQTENDTQSDTHIDSSVDDTSSATETTDPKDTDRIDSDTLPRIPPDSDSLAVTEWPFDISSTDPVIDTNPIDTICGDGILSEDEACDDGNTLDSDGCSGDCQEVAEQYSCIPPGALCHRIASCGDGVLALPELCDDGNIDPGDGCSDLCQTEIGYACSGEPSSCDATECGNLEVNGAESCDDGNDIPFDGCSPSCQLEPNCSEGKCVSECGDGLLLGAVEECDDGNNLSGDGCSDTCTVENGYTCAQDDCETEADCRIRVGVIYRDFPSAHPDFQVSCGSQMDGLVEANLDTDWRPIATDLAPDGCITQLEDWYSNDPAQLGTTIPYKADEIVLFPNGDGSFVNRYGEDGEHWMGYEPNEWTGEGIPVDPIADTVAECEAEGCVPCAVQENLGMGCPPPTVAYDGNPLFFPVDDLAADATTSEGSVPAQYGWASWPWERWLTGEKIGHNFSFTSEVGYWFQFDASSEATLDFSGDDDVWVFVNGQLAVDLGAPHVPQNASVTISAENNFGMEDGEVYRIHFFHAERKATGSSFKLTLVGFNTSRSICRPECGDGVLGLGEECDDGANAGGYGQCGPNCRFDGYCGDGIVQKEYENCDDGNFLNNDQCPSSCRIIGNE